MRWLCHALRMPTESPPHCTLFSKADTSWKMGWGGQPIKWEKDTKPLTGGVARLGAVKLPGWTPPDPSKRWLETGSDTATCLPAILLSWSKVRHSLMFFSAIAYHTIFSCVVCHLCDLCINPLYCHLLMPMSWSPDSPLSLRPPILMIRAHPCDLLIHPPIPVGPFLIISFLFFKFRLKTTNNTA